MSAAALAPALVEIDWRGRPIRLECEWVGAPRESAAPVVVFLHEGLGSVSMWRDFPRAFCARHGFAGFVFSRSATAARRRGRATSAGRPTSWRARPTRCCRRCSRAVGIERPWLFGHSDGATIALLHAARHDVAGVVAVAPHLFVEDVSIASIAKARDAYQRGDLRERLARHHADPDSAFYGWNDVWLAPAFRDWNIEREIATIACPVLAVQGEDDEYGTLEQVRAIVRRLPKTRLLVLPKCGHSPHRDQPEILSREAGRFIVGAKNTH